MERLENVRTRRLVSLVWLCIFLVPLLAKAQSYEEEKGQFPGVPPLPAAFYKVQGSLERLVFLRKLLDDSDGQEQYRPVRDWALAGINYASRYGIDSMKGQFFKDLGEVYSLYYHRPDSAIWYYKRAIAFYPEKLNKRHIFLDRRILWNYSAMGNKDSTLAYLNELETILAGLPESSSAIRSNIAEDLATVYDDYGLSEKSISYFQYASDISLRNKDTAQLSLVLVNLGEVYDEIMDDEKAILFTRESLPYMEGSKNSRASAFSNLGAFFSNLRQYDSAVLYVRRSDAIAAEIGDSVIGHTNMVTMANILINQKKDLGRAANLLNNSLLFFGEHDDQTGVLKSLVYYSNLDMVTHNYAGARQYLEKALALARKGDNKIFIALALQNQAALSTAQGDYKGALAYQDQYMAVKDSISRQKAKDELGQYEMSYKTQQEEQQIQLLTKDNRIKDLQLQNSRRLIIFYAVALLGVLLISGIIFYQRNLRNKIQTQKIRAELETRVLRAQMNPHFIFNSLSSIENFMMKNDKERARDYFSKFATLIRQILDNSRSESVPLVRDMETLQLYVELEQLRFDQKFAYQTIIDPELINGDYNVPPLLIQPYVENAIIHGLAQSEKQGLILQVVASLDKDTIVYTIQDNGIGRVQADIYQRQNRRYHKSVGMDITRQRIEIFNRHAETGETLRITDLYDDDQDAAGTQVQVKLKAV